MTEREKSMMGWVKQWRVVTSFDLMASTTRSIRWSNHPVQWLGVVLTGDQKEECYFYVILYK
jgi:hypothetical protein